MYKKQGFTTIELLAVLAIILTIVGIGIPAYNSWRNRGKIARAKAVIQKIEMGVEMYKTDYGEYPDRLSELISSSNPTFGPYIDRKEVEGSNFIDPWGNEYQYNSTAETVTITSYGPDKERGTKDDISNVGAW